MSRMRNTVFVLCSVFTLKWAWAEEIAMPIVPLSVLKQDQSAFPSLPRPVATKTITPPLEKLPPPLFYLKRLQLTNISAVFTSVGRLYELSIKAKIQFEVNIRTGIKYQHDRSRKTAHLDREQ